MQQPETITAAVRTPSPVILDPDAQRSWNAMQDDVAWLELRDVAWVSFNGEKAVDVLNGLLTNDVSTLADGQSLYAAALTPKG